MSWKAQNATWASAPTEESWSCSLCGGSNWAKKKVCRQCGARKSYAQALTSPSTPPSGRAAPNGGASLPLPLSSGVGQLPASQQSGQAQRASPIAKEVLSIDGQSGHIASKATLSARISTLEKAKAGIVEVDPESALAVTIEAEIQVLKKQKISSKSLGQQLDGCKGAIARATKRRQHAEEQIAAANAVILVENAEVAKMEEELARIERDIAASTLASAAPNGGESEDPLQLMLATMKEVLVALQQPAQMIDKDLIAASLLSAISISTKVPNPDVPMEAVSASAPSQGSGANGDPSPPTVPLLIAQEYAQARMGHRLKCKTGRCLRTAPYNLPPVESFAEPNAYGPLAEGASRV